MSVTDAVATWFDAATGDVSAKRAVLAYAVIALYFSFFILPIVWMVGSTFKPQNMFYSTPFAILPPLGEFTLANYDAVFSDAGFVQSFKNSAIISVSTAFLTLICAVPAAYSLSKLPVPGRDTVLVGFIASYMLPRVLIAVPFFIVLYDFNLIGTHVGIILAHTVLSMPFVIWLLKGYFDEIPTSLIDAAKLDGCSNLTAIVYVILPLSLPGIAVGGFFSFVLSWNDFLFASVISQTQATRTLPLFLKLLIQPNAVDWNMVLSAGVVTMLPVALLFAVTQEWLVEGLAGSGMKGY